MRHVIPLALLSVVVAGMALSACAPEAANGFEGKRAMKHVEAQCDFGPRTIGSRASEQTAEYIAQHLETNGWVVEYDDFAYMGENLRNVVGKKGAREDAPTRPLIILGTHYDTRPLADRDPNDRSLPVLGANDGASGVAVLLEVARVLETPAFDQAEIWLAFFDGEDSGDLDGWPWCVGSQHMADQMAASGERVPEYVLVVDMVGDVDQAIYWEWSSALWLQEKVWAIAGELGYGAQFVPEFKYRILDDHSSFMQWGWPAALMIDFDYPYWHTRYDTVDRVSAESLQRVGDVLVTLLNDEPFATRANNR